MAIAAAFELAVAAPAVAGWVHPAVAVGPSGLPSAFALDPFRIGAPRDASQSLCSAVRGAEAARPAGAMGVPSRTAQ